MEKDKLSHKPVYNELIRISNLYYSGCRTKDMLDYLVGVTALSMVLVDASFRPLDARLVCKHHKAAFEEIPGGEVTVENDEKLSNDTVIFRIAGETISCKIFLLPNYEYYLCIDENIIRIDDRFEEIVRNTLPFLSLTIDKEMADLADDFSGDFYAPFIQLLLNGSTKSPDEIRNICNMYNFNPDLKRVCMVFQLHERTNGTEEIKSLVSKLRRLLNSERYFMIYYNDFAAVFLLYPNKDQDLDIITKSYVLATSLDKELADFCKLRIGISSAHYGIDSIAETFEESFKSIKVQKQLNEPCRASSYFEQSIYHILNIPELKDFRKLSNDIISPLIAYDAMNDTNFFETLQQYFHNSFNIQQTAKRLYIHRNTLTYRLQHIKELLKFDFDFEHNTDALFTLYLCICVYRLGYHTDGSKTDV